MRAIFVVGAALAISLSATADENSDCVNSMNQLLPAGSPIKIKADGRATQMPDTSCEENDRRPVLTPAGAECVFTTKNNVANMQHTYKIEVAQPLRNIADRFNGPPYLLITEDGDTTEYHTNVPSDYTGCRIETIVRNFKGQDKVITYDEKFCNEITKLNAESKNSLKAFVSSLNSLNQRGSKYGAKYGYIGHTDTSIQPNASSVYLSPTKGNATLESIVNAKASCKVEVNKLHVATGAAVNSNAPVQGGEAAHK